MTAELHKLNAQKSSDAPWGVFDVILDELTTNMTNNDSQLVGILFLFILQLRGPMSGTRSM